jgi:N-glycosylase/DNA lyase
MPQSSLTNETQTRFAVQDYDLAATLSSGQAFRWRRQSGSWIGIIGSRWVQLISSADSILALTAEPTSNWSWLVDYMQIETDLSPILASFPNDEPMRAAMQACRGLRLLRQEPWECLASFILSSTKQIVQIQQIIHLLSQRFGECLQVPAGYEPGYAFPTPQRLDEVSEADLRACKMGFRAPYLKAAARLVATSEINLDSLSGRTVEEARAELQKIPGVGRKIADCVLLFAYGFQSAFPVDVWVMKALRELYFRRRHVKLKRLQRFSETHFGPYAGYAQQYLFHYVRRPKQQDS